MGLASGFPPAARSLVAVETAALVDDISLDHPVDLEIPAGRFGGFCDESVEDRLPRPLREQISGHHPGHVAYAAVTDEQIAADEAGHRRRSRSDHDDGAFEPLVEHATPEDANHRRGPRCPTAQANSSTLSA